MLRSNNPKFMFSAYSTGKWQSYTFSKR